MTLVPGQHAIEKLQERVQPVGWHEAVQALWKIAELAAPLQADSRGRVRVVYQGMPLIVVKRGGRLVTLWREE